MKWLPKLACGEWIGAWGLTEYNTGSDAKGMNATAKKQGDHWVLNGTKNFITHGKSCDLAVVIFRNGEKGDSHGMTSFVIEKGTPGFSSGKERATAAKSFTTEIFLQPVCWVNFFLLNRQRLFVKHIVVWSVGAATAIQI